ncbi:MAG TPA: YggS family pyridoxal phosphate-dependent enzyme [Solirubrobacteraceae bacterium]|jgi:hypothetical protein
MVALSGPLDVGALREQLAQARAEIERAAAQAGRDPGAVELLVAGKYIPLQELPKLAEAGVGLIGENRAQELQAKVQAHGELFVWDFIGTLQSRKVRMILPYVRMIHTLASESAARELARWQQLARPELELLIEVNVAGEAGKAGVAPHEIDALIELCPLPVTGLMTMPPQTDDPHESRRWFAALRELAHERGLRRLSMGTSQDYPVAVQEGATIVRLGRSLLA